MPGVGSFVAQRIDPFVTILSTDPRTGFGGGEGTAYLSEVSGHQRVGPSSMPKVEVQVAPAEIALRLRIASGAQVVSRHQERFIDGAPWSLQTSFYPTFTSQPEPLTAYLAASCPFSGWLRPSRIDGSGVPCWSG